MIARYAQSVKSAHFYPETDGEQIKAEAIEIAAIVPSRGS